MSNLSMVERQLLSHLLTPLHIESASLSASIYQVAPKAVIFDIYGTLISSAAGDVRKDNDKGNPEAFKAALIAGGWIERGEFSYRDLVEEGIREQLQRKVQQGVSHPEVDILLIWQKILTDLNVFKEDEQALRLSILSYECMTNPVWPMPNLTAALNAVAKIGLKPGILSNAQFYTPLLMEHFFGKSLEESGFYEDFTVWSYKEGIGKPAPRFFSIMGKKIAQRGILPEEVVYVGNDLRKDIVPAKHQGWVSILFAGDTRSLRLYKDDPEFENIEPDMIITDLGQLAQILT